MSWNELERLVEQAEADGDVRRALSHCRSARELLLACQRLGFAVEPADLRLARRLHRREGSDPQLKPERRSACQPSSRDERCG